MTETHQRQNPSLMNIIAWLVLLGFIGIVHSFIGWPTVLQSWQQPNLNHGYIGLAMLVLLLSLLLRTGRLLNFLPQLGGGSVFLTALRVNLQRYFLKHTASLQNSTAQFPRLMRRHFTIAYAQAQSTQLWFNFLNLHTLMSFALYPMLVIWPTPLRRLAVPILGVWMLIPIVVYVFRQWIQRWLIGRNGTVSEHMQKTLAGLPTQVIVFWKTWALTWAIWLLHLAALTWFLRQFIPEHTVNVLIMAIVAGELALMLPLRLPFNIPIYEAAVTLALTAFIGWQSALIIAINLHLFIIVTASIGGLLSGLLPAQTKSANSAF